MVRSLPRPSTWATALVVAMAASIALAACVAPGGPTDPTPEPSPADPDAVVLRIEVTGGFVPVGTILTELPVFTLYADGRVVTQGPIPEIYPGPLMPNLQVQIVTADDVEAIVAAAREAGLDGSDASHDVTNIADAATTVFTLVLDGEVHRVSAYALFDDPFADPALDEETRTARARLSELQRQLGDLEALLGHPVDAPEPLIAERARLFVTDQVGDPDPNLASQVLPLPPSIEPEEGEPVGYDDAFRCVLVEGEAYEALRPILESANALTVWERDEERYSLLVRPLLPGEAGCPAPVG
jgi:hypothetical protein